MYVNRVKGTKTDSGVIIFNAADANLVFFWGLHCLREQMVFECPDPHHCTDKSILLSTSQWSSCFALIGLIGALGLLHEETETGLIYEISECGNLIRPLGLWQDDM